MEQTEHRRPIRSRILRVLVLFLLLLGIGLLARVPAHLVTQVFAFHGVLVAPFYAAVVYWHLTRQGTMTELVIATALLAVFLGMMSPVMGMSFALVAVFAAVVDGLLRSVSHDRRVFWDASVFGALVFPCTVASGLLTGAYVETSTTIVSDVLFTALSFGLAVLGAVVMSAVEARRAGRE